MSKIRELAVIGTVMIIGVLSGALYVHAIGAQPTIVVGDGQQVDTEKRLDLLNQAIEMVLSNPRTSKLSNITGVKIFSSMYTIFQVEFDHNDTEHAGASYITTTWDGKYRAEVTLRYPDDTGYDIHVNITDGVIGDPVKAVWEDGGKIFKQLP